MSNILNKANEIINLRSKDKPNKKQRAARRKQKERFIEEQRKPNIKRNGVLIKKDNNEL